MVTDDRDRIGLRHRALRSTQLERSRSRRDGDEIGPDGGRRARTHFDMHRVTTTIR